MLDDLGVRIPVLAAPMAGGPTTPQMVVAAAEVGSLGFLAGGYKTAQALGEQIRQVRAATPTFGVNLFVPNPIPVDPEEFRRYAAAIQVEAAEHGLDLATAPLVEDDDDWPAKIELLIADPVPVVSFTFGLPDNRTLAELRRVGTLLVQTITSAEEARLAAEAGVDALAVQSVRAGGHSGTFTPRRRPANRPLSELVAEVRQAVRLPLIGAGGIAEGPDVAATLAAGASAVAVGTLLLLTPESGAGATYRAALAEKRAVETVVTAAFTGRPARGIRNGFTDRWTAAAPIGYPAVHHLTIPLRRAAAAAADSERLHLWAGTGHHAVEAQPTAAVLTELARGL
ncbi:MAG TPA: nitronate monooxygenase [Sporichthyaceae bacterium]|jgi:NAD(P)H-dependent flavin oxidoreductase YrpB (nitropropane dioxygenase family)|nr:nitronate monooxygenase [Sporichthyaceae bacterium]